LPANMYLSRCMIGSIRCTAHLFSARACPEPIPIHIPPNPPPAPPYPRSAPLAPTATLVVSQSSPGAPSVPPCCFLAATPAHLHHLDAPLGSSAAALLLTRCHPNASPVLIWCQLPPRCNPNATPCYPGATLVLPWCCCSVLPWCYSGAIGATLVLLWCYASAIPVLPLRYPGATPVLHRCCPAAYCHPGATQALPWYHPVAALVHLWCYPGAVVCCPGATPVRFRWCCFAAAPRVLPWC
jgi:hypothetical protein